MATATIEETTQEVQITVVEKEEVTLVTLVLDHDEACAIRALVGRIIGDGKFREASTRIFQALQKAGFRRNDEWYNAIQENIWVIGPGYPERKKA